MGQTHRSTRQRVPKQRRVTEGCRMRRKTARPGTISPEQRELDEALSFLPTIEVQNLNAMHPGKREILWSSDGPISMERASARFAQIIEKQRPQPAMLEQLATLARIPVNLRSEFGDRLDAAVLV